MTDENAASGHHVKVVAATKRYGDVTALDAVDLEGRPGEFLVLLGPSGSGKSTLVRALAGIERFDGGTLHFGQRLVSGGRLHTPPDKRDLGMVFQDYALWPHLTTLDNVAYPLRRRRMEPSRRAREALERVGLGQLAGRYPHELSGGEQQRVALARAIVAKPRLLLFDEPLSNLDADLRERLRVEIATLTRETGATAVYITHDQSEAFALADRIAVLRHGRIEQFGNPEDVYRRPASAFVARFTGVAGDLAGTVACAAAGRLEVTVGDRRVLCRSLEHPRVGGTVRVLVRPAATTLASPLDVRQPNALPGKVLDVAYRGRGYDHVVATVAGTLTGVFGQQPWRRGDSCTVSLDPGGCFAFPAAPDAPGLPISRHPTDLTAVTVD